MSYFSSTSKLYIFLYSGIIYCNLNARVSLFYFKKSAMPNIFLSIYFYLVNEFYVNKYCDFILDSRKESLFLYPGIRFLSI